MCKGRGEYPGADQPAGLSLQTPPSPPSAETSLEISVQKASLEHEGLSKVSECLNFILRPVW